MFRDVGLSTLSMAEGIKNGEIPVKMNGAPDPEGAPDPFDLSRLRLSGDLSAGAGVKKILTTVPVRKPSKEWFVRCHPDPQYQIQTYVIELKEDQEVYLVDPHLWDLLITESTFSPRQLITTINRQGVIFLWPIRLPGADGKHDTWNRSALSAANYAMKGWLRVQANMSLGAYEIYQATGNISEPDWSSLLSFQEMIKLAFRDHWIDSADHVVLKRLRGEG